MPIVRSKSQTVKFALLAILLAIASVCASAQQLETYSYDASGNLIRIQRANPSAPLGITGFTPNCAQAAARVTVDGWGFNNSAIVQFNGVQANLVGASPTQLLVEVPASANTGVISVSVGGSTVQSSAPFTVGATCATPPTITSLAPLSGPANAVVSVYGTSLLPQPGQTSVSINGVPATIVMADDAQINFKVPAQVGSGPVTVTTPLGQTTSNAIFQVDQPGISPASVTWNAPLVANGGSQTISLTAGKYAAFTFQGNVNDYRSIQLTAFTSSNNALSYAVYNPQGFSVASGTASPTNASIHLPRVASAGTFTVFLGSGNGSNQFTVNLEADPVLAVDGAPSSIASGAGHTERFVISANAGDNLGLGISNLVLTNSYYGSVNLTVYKPDGTAWSSNTSCSPSTGCDVILSNAPVTGVYGVIVQSPGPTNDKTLTIAFTATASHDLVVPLTAGTVANASVRFGQNARLTFNGTAGTSAAVQIGGSTPNLTLTALKPDGTVLIGATTAYGGGTFNLSNLPTTGTYTVFVTGINGAAATFNALLTSSSSAAVAVDGSSGSFNTTSTPGAYAYFSFSANAGDNLGLGISNLVLTNSSNTYAGIYVYKPDGTLWTSTSSCYASTGCGMVLSNAPSTGTYTVLVGSTYPSRDATMKVSFTATISHDLVVPLTAGTLANVSVRNGQNARLTFSGTAGTSAAVQIGGSTPNLTLTTFKPDGTTLIGATTAYGGNTLNLVNLPATGAYMVFVTTNNGAPATFNGLLTPSSSAAVAVDGSSGSFNSTSTPGAYAYFTFSANAGDNLGLGISNLVLTNSTYTNAGIWIYKPDGTLWTSNTSCYASTGCGMVLSNAPTTGTYTVLVGSTYQSRDPTMKVSFTATLSRDLVVPLTAGTSASGSLRNGQSARLTFSGTAGTSVALQLTGLPTTPTTGAVSVGMYRPDGAAMTVNVCSGYSSCYSANPVSVSGGFTLNLANLPLTGTYTAVITPLNGAAASVNGLVIPSGSAAVAVDGASSNFDTSAIPGQYVYFTFAGTQGDNIDLALRNLTVAHGNRTNVGVDIYNPDRTVLLGNNSCDSATGGCGLRLTNLPMTGTYSVIVRQPYPFDYPQPGLTMTFTATVSHDLVLPLTAGTPASASLRSGQAARLTFSGTAGASIGLQLSGLPTTPTTGATTIGAYRPDGAALSIVVCSGYSCYSANPVSVSGGFAFNLASLPLTGTYTVLITSLNGVAASVNALLMTSDAAAVTVDGASSNFDTTAAPGGYAYFTFAGTQGDNIGLALRNLTVAHGNRTNVGIDVYKPDRTILSGNNSCDSSTGGCGLSLTNLPVTGTYTVIVRQPYPFDYPQPGLTMTFTATVSHDLVVPLTAGTTASVSLLSGQHGRCTWSGTAAGAATLTITGIGTTPAGQSVTLSVLKPDGTTLSSTTATSSYTFNLTNLPSTGTYTLLVAPANGVAGNLQVKQQ